MSSRKVWVISIIVILGPVLIGMSLALLSGDAIYSGVRAAGADLGGLSVEQAIQRLDSKAATVDKEKVALRYAGETRDATVADMGGSMDVRACALAAYQVGRGGNILRRIEDIISARRHGINVPVRYSFDKNTAHSYLRKTAKEIDRTPANAELSVKDGNLIRTPEKPGVKLDIEKSLVRIAHAVNSGGRTVDLVVATDEPKITVKDLEGIDGLLASYSTPYKPWERDRTHNLGIACRSINGALLKPGEVLSYNKVVGPRLKEYGFRDAPIFVKGEVEPGTGGGVCQVSTTVYNAALLANMKILRRAHHSRPVVYAPVGRDATVAYPAVDLKFENTSDAPIYIQASLGSRTVNVSIFGKKSDEKVSLASAGHRVIPASVKEVQEDGIEPGKRVVRESGRAGHRVSTYRIVKIGDEIVKRELISNDYYQPESRIIAVPKPDAKPQPESKPSTAPT